MWLPVASERKSTALPCVIYMHGNSSGRVEAIGQLATVLSIGATMVAFDFCGSGLSEGEYVSLGFFEREDLQTVVEHIRDAGGTSLIALWGRSMGAATALLHGGRDPSMACMVLDSSFTDLSHLAEELVERGRRNGLFAPSFAVWIALRAIRSSVLSTAGFDIKDISPISVADHCFIPALFIAAESDAFIGPHHSQRLCEVYSGDKNIILVKGDHNSVRPLFLFDSVSIFLINALRIPEEWLLPGMSSAYVGRSPWGRPAAPQFSKTLSSVAASSTSSLKSRDRKPNSLSPTTTSAVSTEAVASSSGSSLSAQELQEESDRAVAWQLMQEEIELMDRSQQGKERQKRTAVASQKEDDAKQTDLQEEDFEEMDVGMTRARQDEVNAAICGVFGGTVTKAGTSANSESGSTESSNTGKKT